MRFLKACLEESWEVRRLVSTTGISGVGVEAMSREESDEAFSKSRNEQLESIKQKNKRTRAMFAPPGILEKKRLNESISRLYYENQRGLR